MDCSEVRKRLDEYVMGDLPHVECLRVDLHLRHCVPCQQDRDETLRFFKSCRNAMLVRDVRDDFGNLMMRIAESEARMRAESASAKRKLRFAWRRSAAAVLLLAVGITLLHMANPLRWLTQSIENVVEAAESQHGDPVEVPVVTVPFVSPGQMLNTGIVEFEPTRPHPDPKHLESATNP
ncbi:MAG: hypothetical protein AMXMBFR84_24340 [Candidatus Hydrogenedentota bacterium]